MCIRSITHRCPGCGRKSVGLTDICQPRRRELRRVQEACRFAFWVKEQKVCSTIDNIDHAIQKRCRDCDQQDIRDILERHELRRGQLERDREQDRREERQAAIDRGNSWIAYVERHQNHQRELETMRSLPGPSSSQDITTQRSTAIKVEYHIESPASTSSSTSSRASTTVPPRRPLPLSHPSRLPIQTDQRRCLDSSNDDGNITYTPSSSSESSW